MDHADVPQPRARRRAAALAVLVVSVGALVATSEAHYEARLEEAIPLDVSLTASMPKATAVVELAVSRDSLGEPRPIRPTVAFRVEGDEFEHRFALDVQPVGVDALPTTEFGSLAFDLERLCAVDIECVRRFRVTVEWLDPGGEEARPRVLAELAMSYASDKTEALPSGVEARWTVTESFVAAPVAPSVDAATDSETIELDADRPAALRHVVLTGSGGVSTGDVVAFLDLRVGQVPVSDVQVSATADGTGRSLPAGATHSDVFPGCPPNGSCEAGFTILFQLMPGDADRTAVLDWRWQAIARFEGADVAPADARLAAALDRAVDIPAAAPALVAEAAGEVEPGVRQQHIILEANAASLPEAAFGGLTPTAVGVLTVEGGEGAYVRAFAGLLRSAEATLDTRDPATLVVFPLVDCRYGEECSNDISLNVRASRGSADPAAIPVRWRLELRLIYPLLDAVPPGAELRLDVRQPSR